MNLVDRTLIRFALVGLINSVLGLLIIFLAMYFGFDDVLANAIGYSGGFMISFILNKNWTFINRGSVATNFARFLVVTLVAYCLNLITVILMIDGLQVNAFISQSLGVPVYAVISYLGCKHYAFSNNDK
jgi:putative flippase GtrA